MSNQVKVCPWWLNRFLDNPIRRVLMPTGGILEPYLSEGMKFVDLGCGGGSYSIHGARLVGETGSVTALDIQEKMLGIVEEKVKREGLERIVHTHLAKKTKLNLEDKYDFALGMFMVHEVPDCFEFFKELKSCMKQGSMMLVVEPKGHVSNRKFKQEVEASMNAGFEFVEYLKLGWLCRAYLISA